jgi:urease accessory protein
MWTILQLADAAFPSGAFAHSGGLEAVLRLGELEDLDAFVDASLWQAGRMSLPFIGATEPLEALDRILDGMLVSHVANRASRAQGRSFVGACVRIFDRFEELDARVRDKSIHAHFAPVFGAISRELGIERTDAMRVHLHGALRGVLSAAVRLNVIGPHEAQRMTHARAELLERVLARCKDLCVDQAAQPAPLLDLFGALHDSLDVRLFVS